MSDATKTTRRRSWAREIVEIAALFLAVGMAHTLATLLGHEDPGPLVLMGLGGTLVLGAALHRRLSTRPAGRRRAAEPPQPEGGLLLWRIRMRVAERPGRLAGVARAFGRLECNILSLHIAPTGSAAITPGGCEALDEFVVEAPANLAIEALGEALSHAGGHDVLIVPAGVKDLVDPAIQALTLAQRVGADPEQLPLAMAELLRATEVEWRHPSDAVDEDAELNTAMVVTVRPGHALLLRRPDLPFTPTEAARATALAAAARQARYSRS
ncbi:hypothetical protein [Thermoactinospora rubra]|uniref:hypothetical protein n=1 Tax=Thermoactinospora rubra TaxID=1088767 RepID=UPI000A11B2A8|nr:hypothetical protein [Thermoactinospora rubra]